MPRDALRSWPSARDGCSPGRPLRTQATLLGCASLTVIAAAVIAPALPGLRQEFSGRPGVALLVQLTLTVTSLAIAVSAPVAGALADRLGRRPLLVGSLVLYAVAGTAGYLASTLELVMATRVALGIGVAGVMTGVSALIADLFDGERRAAFLGRQAAAASLGGVVFIPLAGVLAGIDARAPFLVYALALLPLVPAVLLVRDSRPGRGRAAGGAAPAAGVLRTSAAVYLIAVLATRPSSWRRRSCPTCWSSSHRRG